MAREGWEVQEEAGAMVDPGQPLESSPPPLQLPHSESQESIKSSHSLQKGSKTSLPKETSPPSRSSSKASLHEKLQIPSEKSSRVSSAVSLTKVDEGAPDKRQARRVEQDGWPQAPVELLKTYTEEKMVGSKAPEEQSFGRRAEVRLWCTGYMLDGTPRVLKYVVTMVTLTHDQNQAKTEKKLCMYKLKCMNWRNFNGVCHM